MVTRHTQERTEGMKRKRVISCRKNTWKWDEQGGRSVAFSVPHDWTDETFYLAFTNPANKVPVKRIRISRAGMHCLALLYLEEITGIKASNIGKITVVPKSDQPGEPS